MQIRGTSDTDGLRTHEWAWLERKLETTVADGGEPSDTSRTTEQDPEIVGAKSDERE